MKKTITTWACPLQVAAKTSSAQTVPSMASGATCRCPFSASHICHPEWSWSARLRAKRDTPQCHLWLNVWPTSTCSVRHLTQRWPFLTARLRLLLFINMMHLVWTTGTWRAGTTRYIKSRIIGGQPQHSKFGLVTSYDVQLAFETMHASMSKTVHIFEVAFSMHVKCHQSWSTVAVVLVESSIKSVVLKKLENVACTLCGWRKYSIFCPSICAASTASARSRHSCHLSPVGKSTLARHRRPLQFCQYWWHPIVVAGNLVRCTQESRYKNFASGAPPSMFNELIKLEVKFDRISIFGTCLQFAGLHQFCHGIQGKAPTIVNLQ